MKSLLCKSLLCAMATLSLVPFAAVAESAATALYLGDDVSLPQTLADPTDLWIPADRLPEVNGFVLKPEGACLDDLCIPLEQNRDNEIVITRPDETGAARQWFSLTAFARKMSQAYVMDLDRRIWSFAPVPAAQSALHERATAPDFELADRQGKNVRLSDFRGKKVVLLTWASW